VERRRRERALLHIPLHTPTVQRYPLTAAETLAKWGRTPTEIFIGDMASGDLVGKLGNHDLAARAGNSLRYQQPWIAWDGSSMHGRQCVEFSTDADDAFDAADSDVFDPSQSITFLLHCAAPKPASSNRGIVSKREAAGDLTGFELFVATSGGISLAVDWGGGSSTSSISLGTGNAGFANGAKHWVAATIDLDAGEAYVTALYGEGVHRALGDSLANTATFSIGRNRLLPLPGLQVYAMYVFTGADGEGWTREELQAINNHCRIPHSRITTYDRGCLIAPVVANESGFGVRVLKHHGAAGNAHVDFPHEYFAGATRSVQKLSGCISRAQSNLLSDSENLAGAAWSGSAFGSYGATTVVEDDAEAPDGHHVATKVVASADNGVRWQDVTTELAQEYTFSLTGLKRGDASDVSGRLVLVRTDTEAEIAAVAFSAGATYDDSATLHVASVPTTETRVMIEIDTSGEGVYPWGLQFEAGKRSVYRPNAETAVAQDCHCDNPGGGTIYSSCRGDIEIHAVAREADLPEFSFLLSALEVDKSAPYTDRHFIQSLDDEMEARLYDADGTIAQRITSIPDIDRTDGHTVRVAWDSGRDLPGRSDAYGAHQDDDRQAGDSGTWTPGNGATAVHLGQRHTATKHYEGGIEEITIWDRPRKNA
jgi:hypothetical protein